MASFQSLIAPAIEALRSTKTVKDRKDHDDIKVLSPFIIGGVSKMTRPDFDGLLTALEKFTTTSPHLDEEQRAVVEAPLTQHVRVVAGAGSGKTTTIIARIKRLMAVTTPASICVLTFNVKSRDSLNERLAAAFGFAVKFPVYTVDKYARDHLAAANDVSVKEYCGAAAKLPRDTLDNMAHEYQYVFFDEFQDVNEEQFALLRNLTRGAPTCVVGDDLQNIYQFRGTNNYYIINFDKLVGGVDTFLITRNYRSAAKIVDIANIIAAGNSDRIHKTLKCTKQFNGDVDVEFCHNATKHVCDMIAEQLSMGTPPGSIAVLARNKVPLVKIETEFARRGITVTARLDDYAADETAGRVVLSTIHRAKGLEWDTVYIVGLQDKYFPSHVDGGIKNINEERRLFYVAVTRARSQLTFIVSDEGEHPGVSRFLHEIATELPSWGSIPMTLLRYNNKNAERPYYPVTKVIESLQGAQLAQMRERGLLPTVSAAKTAFCDKAAHLPELSAAALEADYGNFCDAYLTRKLQVGGVVDPNVEAVIAGTALSADEHRALPGWFINRLKESYKKYVSGVGVSGDGGNDAIYDVSLCPRICDGRNRLVYRDVKAIFAAQTAALEDNYARFLETDLASEPSRHKIRLEYNAGKKIVGVLDFITDDAVVEIKCSSAELEIEWVIQLLLYRALLDVNGYGKLDKLVVVNVLRGEISIIHIPHDYDSVGLLDYVTGVIKSAAERGGIVASGVGDNTTNLDLDYKNGGATEFNGAVSAAPVTWSRRPDAAGFAAIDVENNTVTGRITEIGAFCGGVKYSWNIAGAVIDWRASDIIHVGDSAPVPFRAAIGALLDVLGGVTCIVGHGIGTDLTKLTNNILVAAPEYLGAWRQMLTCTVIVDTLAAAKKWKKLPNYKLGTVYEAVTGTRLDSAHNAGEDAAATAAVYLVVSVSGTVPGMVSGTQVVSSTS